MGREKQDSGRLKGKKLLHNNIEIKTEKQKQEEVQKALDEKMERWMYLEELAAKIATQ